MDVLELPRPVINFLRTMAKESCRYALSWDIFGGPDSVTLTLTWKLIDDEPLTSIINEASTATASKSTVSNYDDPHVRSRSNMKSTNVSLPHSSSSPRRSRRDETTVSNLTQTTHDSASVPAIFRSSRGKSLEGSSSQLNKTLVSHPVNHYHHRQKKTPPSSSKTYAPTSPRLPSHNAAATAISPSSAAPSDPIYGHLYDTRSASVVKCATISSLSSSSPSPQPNPPRPVRTTTTTPPTQRQFIRPASSSNYAKLQRMTKNHLARHDDDDDDDEEKDDDDDETLDPWVKRFECSLEEHSSSHPHDDTKNLSEEKECSVQRTIPTHPHPPHPVHHNEMNFNDSTLPSGKVKFKSKPDYF